MHVPTMQVWACHDSQVKHVVLPRLEELDIVYVAMSGYRPSGNQYFEEHRAGDSCHPYCFLPPQSFNGAPSLTSLRFCLLCDPNRSVTMSHRKHCANLRSVELNHEPWEECAEYLELLPLSLTEPTVRLWPAQHHRYSRDIYRIAEDLKLIKKAATAGMRLHKLTLIGFTRYDVDRFAIEAEGICLAGIRELVLEPNLSEADPIADTHPVDLLLYVFPDLEKLHIGGQHLASLNLGVPCPLLKELSLNLCPASLNVNCTNLGSLRLEHSFRMGSAHRAADLHKLDMSAWACGQLDSLTVVLGSYRKGDVFQVQCRPGTAMTATWSHPAEEWQQWVIGLSLGASLFTQSRQHPIRFVCTSSHGMLTWVVA